MIAAVLRFTKRAEEDLRSIAAYTLSTWGIEQCGRYIEQLERCCRLIAESPTLGHPCDELAPQMRRMKQGKHVVYFRLHGGGVLVVRILHERMLPDRHLGDLGET